MAVDHTVSKYIVKTLETQLLGLNYSSAIDRSVILLKLLNASLFCSPYL